MVTRLAQIARIELYESFILTRMRNDTVPNTPIEQPGNIPERRIELRCCFHYNTRPFLWLAVDFSAAVAKTLLLDKTNEKNISAQRPEA